MVSKREIALFPVIYWGPVAYYALLGRYRQPVLDIHETFAKQTYRNRAEILGANGVSNLTLPVRARASNIPTGEMRVDFRENWRRQHWHAIRSAYGKTPFFEHYAPYLESYYNQEHPMLVDWCTAGHQILKKWIPTLPDIVFSTEFIRDGMPVYRNRFKPSKKNWGCNFPSYYQAFRERFGFVADLSILDAIFNLGPETAQYLDLVAAQLPENLST